MQIKDLKMLFDAGSLKKAQIVLAPMGSGYILLLDNHVLQAQRGGDRLFKSLDAAAESAARIGFKHIHVTL
ncbi:plasmid replication protein RepB [Vibrio aestuarianus]|uniref:plasmid replication protein RepB n=1 Tax=Vibrio aestuarianus TaxID=28171 RepID=UPI00237C8C42|nr:plasmid replication protein RepB [Vibrio aestuarianus]MDE1335393.1 plasmid replication protein RepB [Vibrio aestuarianus]MDE1335399.1 plasmid replication protein RepB [Vibrio aestuarianus]